MALFPATQALGLGNTKNARGLKVELEMEQTWEQHFSVWEPWVFRLVLCTEE